MGKVPAVSDYGDYVNRTAAQRQESTKLYNADYGLGSPLYDFDKDARNARLRIGRSWATFDDLISYYDVARMPDIDGATMPLVGHLFFTRPSFNVCVPGQSVGAVDSLATANFNALCNNSITATWARDRYGMRLLNMLSDCSSSFYMPIFTNRAMSYVVSDMHINTIEKGHTFFGHYVKYGATTQDYRTAGTISIEFRNDVYQSIIKAIALWISYISIISFSDSLRPAEKYEKNAILDYCGSIYYLVTKMDMTTLVYWEKLTGVFPKVLPLSVFSYSDSVILEDKLTVDFEYAIRSDPCDPNVLFDLNVLSAGTTAGAQQLCKFGAAGQQGGPNFGQSYPDSRFVLPRNYEGPYGMGNVFATAPAIQTVINADGSITYLLQFMK